MQPAGRPRGQLPSRQRFALHFLKVGVSLFYYRLDSGPHNILLMNTPALEKRKDAASVETSADLPSPRPILNAAYAFAVTRALSTAIELDIFTKIATGLVTLDALNRDTGCSRSGLSILLHALTALEFLAEDGGSYSLPPVSGAYLTKTSPHYIGGYVSVTTAHAWPVWAQLSTVVRTGKPYREIQGEQPDGEFFCELVPALHVLTSAAARAAAAALGNGNPGRPSEVLDVAAGSAVWSLAIARQNREARVTVIDLPDVLERVTEKYVEREGNSARFTFRPGNLRTMDLGEGLFDLVILGHICHGEGAERSRSLIRRAYRALRPGGQILIAELLPDDDRHGPLLPLLFGLHMLVLTDGGGTFTLAEFRSWLSEAGFDEVRTLAVPAPSPLILATKP
jgi:ubiquinone/menaquinone biosynthesis C-methylase UbiE